MPHNANGNLNVNAIPQQSIIEVPDSQLTPDPNHFFKTISHFWDSKDLFPHPPEIDDVQQVGIGDCFFLAAVHSIISIEPLKFEDMMCDLRGGWVVVRLFDSLKQPIYYRIQKTYLARDTGTFSSQPPQGHRAFWIYMLEKAYAIFRLRVEKHQVTPKKWVTDRESGRLTQKDLPKRDAVTYIESLTGGFSENAFQTLLGGEKLRVEILSNENDSRAVGFLELILQKRPGNEYQSQEKAAFELIFGVDGQTAATDFENQFGVPKMIAFGNFAIRGKTIRRETVLAFFDTHYSNLQHATRLLIDAFVKKHFPGKRGTGLYTPYQVELYKTVKRALALGNYVAIGTGTNLGRNPGSMGQTNEQKVKGLAGPHAYQVCGVMKTPDPQLRFLKVRNPWLQYVRQYDWKANNSANEEERRLTAIDRQQLNQQNTIVGDMGSLGNGAFLVELSDVTKRFRKIYIGTDPDKAMVSVANLQNDD
jgi:Calpain family cysteine protease